MLKALVKSVWNTLAWFGSRWYGKLAAVGGALVGYQRWRREWLSGPEIVLRFCSSGSEPHGYLVADILGSGSARNIRIGEMETGRSLGTPGKPISSLEIRESGRLEFSARSKKPNQFGDSDMPLDAFFMETLEKPMTVTVLHEDANGRRFKTKFKVIYDDTRYQPEPRFEQVSRRRRFSLI